ncbi:conserved hypothetical protein [Ricinus communis]|uniref:Uncharacterized protein n=1 Tax=Ricinus communis TaxID=3988 RepID=B9SFH7_RICCO|nr:conserved hypothetical protein [Ricinus communis]
MKRKQLRNKEGPSSSAFYKEENEIQEIPSCPVEVFCVQYRENRGNEAKIEKLKERQLRIETNKARERERSDA